MLDMKKIPMGALLAARYNLGLGPDDPSRDVEIARYSAEQLFTVFCEWHGFDNGWAEAFINTLDAAREAELPDSK